MIYLFYQINKIIKYLIVMIYRNNFYQIYQLLHFK